jgi:excisionase family DNA binding protein
MDKLLTPVEVAELLRVTPKTVRRWALRGRLPAVRMGPNTVRFAECEIASALAAMRGANCPGIGEEGQARGC